MKLSSYENQEFWDRFDPIAYVKNFYLRIGDEEKEVIKYCVKFYQDFPLLDNVAEIGIGPNLYPVMTILPFIEKLDAIEYSHTNITYLKNQLEKLDKNWYLFWNLLKREDKKYQGLDLMKNLRKKVRVIHGNIYNLPDEKYDYALMHTVAESITNNYSQFKKACQKFINCVKPGGYLLATFSENSGGYSINGLPFPAYKVDKEKLVKIFQKKTHKLKIYRIPKKGNGYKKEGYTGLLILTAKRL